MSMQSIKIDLEVYKIVESKRDSFEESPNDILRRLLGLPSLLEESKTQEANDDRQGWAVGGVFIRKGTPIRSSYKGHVVKAAVVHGGLEFNGKKYTSPSGAAMEATGNNVNGWRFWEYLDQDSGIWRQLDFLRKLKR